jgi:hypothetical protein
VVVAQGGTPCFILWPSVLNFCYENFQVNFNFNRNITCNKPARMNGKANVSLSYQNATFCRSVHCTMASRVHSLGYFSSDYNALEYSEPKSPTIARRQLRSAAFCNFQYILETSNVQTVKHGITSFINMTTLKHNLTDMYS